MHTIPASGKKKVVSVLSFRPFSKLSDTLMSNGYFHIFLAKQKSNRANLSNVYPRQRDILEKPINHKT